MFTINNWGWSEWASRVPRLHLASFPLLSRVPRAPEVRVCESSECAYVYTQMYLCMPMCAHMSVCSVCLHMCVHECRWCVCVSMYLCVPLCMCVHACIWCVRLCVCMCKCIYIHPRVYVCVCICTHVHRDRQHRTAGCTLASLPCPRPCPTAKGMSPRSHSQSWP